MKKYLLLLLFALIYACNKEVPLEQKQDGLPAKDTVINFAVSDTIRKEVIDGVFLWADSLKDVYSLDENILAKVHLKNESNKNGFPIFIGSYPPIFFWHIENNRNEFIAPDMVTVGMAEYRDTIKTGRQINQDITWSQYAHDPVTDYSGLKAFAGNYVLIIYLRGEHPGDAALTKYFKISETGNPLSYSFEQNYNSKDTVKLEFVMRNRTGSAFSLNRESDSCSFIFTAHNPSGQRTDTLLVNRFLPELPVYTLQAFTDLVLCRFYFSKKGLIEKGIKGGVDAEIKINFRERALSGKQFLFIN